MPKRVPIRASYLENALTGRRWTRPVLEKFLGARNNQKIRRLEDQKKNLLRNAVHNDVLRELILRVITPVSRGGKRRYGLSRCNIQQPVDGVDHFR
jgi:hypothetical protein